VPMRMKTVLSLSAGQSAPKFPSPRYSGVRVYAADERFFVNSARQLTQIGKGQDRHNTDDDCLNCLPTCNHSNVLSRGF